MDLHPNQLAILKFVREYRLENPYAPNYREIADHLGTWTATVGWHVTKLEERGLITKGKKVARSLNVTDEGIEAIAYSLLTPTLQTIVRTHGTWGISESVWLDALNRAKHALWEDDDE